jgi:hypothetical protein
MTTKADYTESEWELLLEVPSLVGTAVMLAGRSGIGGSMKEAFAIASGVLDAREGYESNELIRTLIDARVVDKQRSAAEKLSGNPYLGKPPEEIRDIAIEKCRQVAVLLADKATSGKEATEFKQWALSVGEKVANAAKEGAFLGIGGERVCEEETVVLDAVTKAFQLSSS